MRPRPPDDDTLVFAVNHHVSVHVVRQSVDVRRVLILGLGQNQQDQRDQRDKTEVRNTGKEGQTDRQRDGWTDG